VGECVLLADSVEKIRFFLTNRIMTAEDAVFARCYAKSEPGTLYQFNDFNLKRALFYRGSQGRFFDRFGRKLPFKSM
jgi:hypothetical protein